MTKRDYQLLASAIRTMHLALDGDRNCWDTFDKFVVDMAGSLKCDNPKFDEKKFRKAVYND